MTFLMLAGAGAVRRNINVQSEGGRVEEGANMCVGWINVHAASTGHVIVKHRLFFDTQRFLLSCFAFSSVSFLRSGVTGDFSGKGVRRNAIVGIPNTCRSTSSISNVNFCLFVFM